MSAQIERLEQIIDACGAAGRIEALLPIGVRPRQLRTRTLLIGIVLAMLAGRDALLTNVHAVLLKLPEADRQRLEVIADCNDAERELTYRQHELTYRLIGKRLAKDKPDGSLSEALSAVLDALLEASVTVLGEPSSTSYAVDGTDQETWSRPPPKQASEGQRQTDTVAEDRQPTGDSNAEPAITPDAQQPEARARRSDREASWGHRIVTHPANNEMFFRLLPAGRHDRSRRARPRSARARPPHAPGLMRPRPAARARARPPADGQQRHHDRRPARRLRLLLPAGRALGAAAQKARRQPHPRPPPQRPRNQRHPPGRDLANGQLYCPATPKALLELPPLPRGASHEHTQAHDQKAKRRRRRRQTITELAGAAGAPP